MITDTLSMTIQLLESYQKECPEIYKEYEQELDDLDAQMLMMIEKLITAENIKYIKHGLKYIKHKYKIY